MLNPKTIVVHTDTQMLVFVSLFFFFGFYLFCSHIQSLALERGHNIQHGMDINITHSVSAYV